MFNLENNENTRTLISRVKMFNRVNSRKLLQKRFHLTVVINIVERQVKDKIQKTELQFSTLSLILHNLISLYVKSL